MASLVSNKSQFQYTICEELGKGAYGTVYRAIEKATGKTWAAKMVQVFRLKNILKMNSQKFRSDPELRKKTLSTKCKL